LVRGNKGFTLTEILIVLAILGVLAGVVIPRFISLFGRGEIEAAESELYIVRTAVEVYMSVNDGNAVAKDDVQLSPDDVHYGEYLSSSTAYKYTITADGVVMQGDSVE
jgi:prepilin-type N-terminal cleavage/methylation domain-containing protein